MRRGVYALVRHLSLWVLGGVLFAAPTGAQADVLTIEEARQLLTPYLQPPDTGFLERVVVESSLEGHPEYLFYGSTWSTYRINAVTREKTIRYSGLSPLEPGQQPAAPLAPVQLRQAAVDFVAARFPGYQAGMFTVSSADAIEPEDCNEFDVFFTCYAASGATMLALARVYVEEDTGVTKAYDEQCLPTLINTWPSITEAQAVVAGRQWIVLNCDADPYWGELVTPRELYPIELMVDVDPLLNQALVYRIPYRAAVLFVDAHTGAVLRIDGWLSSGLHSRSASRRQAPPPEAFWDVALAGGGLSMHHAAVVVSPGRAYIWCGYALALGIKVERKGRAVVLESGGRKVRLPLQLAQPQRDRPVAWDRAGELYVPVRSLLRLTDRLRAEVANRRIVLWHPYSRVAWRDWAAARESGREPPSPSLQEVLGGDPKGGDGDK